jgi:hypothetical protein
MKKLYQIFPSIQSTHCKRWLLRPEWRETVVYRTVIIEKKRDGSMDSDEYIIPTSEEDILDRKTREMMEEHINKEVREAEKKIKEMEKDVIYNAFLKEFRTIELRIWNKVRENKIPIKESTITYVRERVNERREALEKKYKHIARLVGNDVKNANSRQVVSTMEKNESDPEKKKAFNHLLEFMNNEENFNDDPLFLGLQKAYEKVSGKKFNERELKRKVTPKELEKFLKMLDGEEGKEMEKRINSVLNDKTLRSLGIEPNEYRPANIDIFKTANSSNDASAENANSGVSDSQKNNRPNFQFNQTKIDNIKYLIKKEVEKNPGLVKHLQEETGADIVQIFEDFEKSLKNGELFSQLSNADRYMLANALMGENEVPKGKT